jgi:hypothetical protein
MIDLSKTPRCARYLKALNVNLDETGMNEYWSALCIAEGFSEKSLKKFGGIDFHTMKGPRLLARMEEFLEYHSKAKEPGSGKLNAPKKAKQIDAITSAVSDAEIVAAMTPKCGWKAKQLALWGVPWPPPKGWRERLVANFEAKKMTA